MLKLFNTLNKKKEKFVPSKKVVGLYSCGPTVYYYQHIGNMRAFIFSDILKRVLLFNGFKVKHVMNITDVGHLTSDADEGEDKMTKGLRREGLSITLKSMQKLSQKYTEIFLDDLKRLNIKLPNIIPKASDHIKEDLEFIAKLEKKGFTYKTSDGLYFDTSLLKDYGKLLGKNVKAEGRIKKNSEKKNPKDFALWKFNKDLGWNTKWGKGFPGWHIECSVMASKYLGKQFDIHCGGKEHIPIHHTNEIAQSEALFGKKPWVKYWLHNEWLILASGEKMAKSGNNFITLDVLLKKGFDPLDYRYFCLGANYRNPLMFNYEALEGAKKARKRLVDFVMSVKKKGKIIKSYLTKFTKEINDDLNTPKALAIVWEVVKDSELKDSDKKALLLEFDKVLGLNLKEAKEAKVPAAIKKLAEERLKARNEKDWNRADKLREEIKKKGYLIDDKERGYVLRRD